MRNTMRLLLAILLCVSIGTAQQKYFGGQTQNKYRTADTTYGTASLVNLGNMYFPVVNGTYYHFKFVVVYQTAAVTTGLKLGLLIPGATVFAAEVTIGGEAAAGTASSYSGMITASGGSVTSANVAVANTNYIAIVEGILIPSANGSIALQWSPEVAANATIKQGTCAWLWVVK